MARGCKQVPLDATKGIVRWAHPDGYFLNAQGQKIAHDYNPAKKRGFTAARRTSNGNTGGCYPAMRGTGSKNCHLLMALAFFGPRTIDPATGKVCVCHHLIPDPLDYRPANLLCWLTRAEHAEADRRQRALRKVVPHGDLHIFSYDRLRELQDPRTMSKETFEEVFQRLKDKHFSTDQRTWDEIMQYEMTHHTEF